MSYREEVIQNNFRPIFCYAALKEFYENEVGHSDYKYNIITPRKAMGLDKVFFDPCQEVTNKCIYATTKSYILYIEDICKEIENGSAKEHKFISIIDDILLYGRTIDEFLGKFINIIAKKTNKTEEDIGKLIDINVFTRSDKPCQIKRERYNSLKTKIWFKYEECMRLSDIIMKTFYELPVSNTTTIVNYYYQKKGDILENILKQQNEEWDYVDLDEVEKESILRKRIEKLGFKSMIFYKKNYNEVQNGSFQLIRFYINKKAKKAFIIPYTFLDQMEQNQLNGIWEKIGLNFLGKNEEEAIKRGYSVLEYEFLINLMSINFMNDFISDFSLDLIDFKMDKNIMNISFGKKLSDYLMDYAIGKENRQELSNLEYCPKYYEGDEYLKDKYNQLLSESDEEEAWEILQKYFNENGKIDDSLAGENNEKSVSNRRTQGLTVKYMEQTYFAKKNYSKKFYFGLISTMDQGISALSVQDNAIKNNGIEDIIVYGQIMQSGEQAYRVGIEELSPLIYFKILLKKKYRDRIFDIRQRENALKNYEKDVIEDFLNNTEDANKRKMILELNREMIQQTYTVNLIRTDEELRESVLYKSAKKMYEKYAEEIKKYVLG